MAPVVKARKFGGPAGGDVLLLPFEIVADPLEDEPRSDERQRHKGAQRHQDGDDEVAQPAYRGLRGRGGPFHSATFYWSFPAGFNAPLRFYARPSLFLGQDPVSADVRAHWSVSWALRRVGMMKVASQFATRRPGANAVLFWVLKLSTHFDYLRGKP